MVKMVKVLEKAKMAAFLFNVQEVWPRREQARAGVSRSGRIEHG